MWKQLKNANTISIIILTTIYYIVAIYVVYKYGYKWIVPVWSFPIVILFVIAFTNNPHRRLKFEKQILWYTALAYLIITLAIAAAIFAVQFTKNRLYVLAVGFLVWFLLVGAFWWWSSRAASHK